MSTPPPPERVWAEAGTAAERLVESIGAAGALAGRDGSPAKPRRQQMMSLLSGSCQSTGVPGTKHGVPAFLFVEGRGHSSVS
jgi:hypothetical protein